MAGIILHFISQRVSLRVVSQRTSLSVVMACVAFTLVFLGVCRLPVSHFWRESLSLVSWCLSYFALHFVFIACVAYKLFSWRVSPSGCFYGVCRLQVVFTACVAFQLAISACVAYKLFSWRVSPSGCFHGVCRLQVAVSGVCRFRQFHGVFRILLSILCLQRVSLISCFHGVCRLELVFTACVAFRLFSRPGSPSSWPFLACVAYKLFSRRVLPSGCFSWRVSPSGCFDGVCRLQVVSTACVTFRLAVSGVCRFHSSFMVSFIFCSPFGVHSTCRLQLVRACTTFKLLSWRVSLRLAAFLTLDVFRLVFITCVALRFPQPLQRVSLSGWFVYGIFCSQFSFRSLCHFQRSIWHLLLLFIQYVVPPFWDRFSWCVISFVLMYGTSFWSCISHFLYFAVRVFSVCVLLRISCSLSRFFFSRLLLLTFSFPQLVPVFGNFLLYFFVCSSMLQKLKHEFFLVYFLGPFCFLVFYSLGIFKRC